MKAQITKIIKTQSKYGGDCYLLSFRDSQGKSYRSWLYPACGNFRRWLDILQAGPGTIVDNLNVVGRSLVNADSYPHIVKEAEQYIPPVKQTADSLF